MAWLAAAVLACGPRWMSAECVRDAGLESRWFMNYEIGIHLHGRPALAGAIASPRRAIDRRSPLMPYALIGCSTYDVDSTDRAHGISGESRYRQDPGARGLAGRPSRRAGAAASFCRRRSWKR